MLDVALKHRFADMALDLSFTAPEGVTALFGPSGAGKSSVIHAVAGLMRCQSARIVLNHRVLEDASTRLAPHRRRCAVVFQDARLFPHLTVRQNLLYGARYAPPGGLGLDQVVGLLGLRALLDRRPATLSGGEAQRTAIGRALLANPELLLMDEPLSALDAPRKAEILPFLESLAEARTCPILYVSHSLAEIARLAGQMVVLDKGRLVTQGTPEAVLSDPSLAPLLGLTEMGSVITAIVQGTDPDGLTRLDTTGGPIFVPGLHAAPGARLRLRLPAQDVILSRNRPEGLSALNILATRILSLTEAEGSAFVQLALGEQKFLARLTRRSVAALGLQPGQEAYAILKTVALAQGLPG